MLEKTLENPLDCKEIQPVHPKGDQSWLFIGSTEAETPILWPPDAKSWPIGKDPGAGKDWGQEEKGTTKDEMVGWHHRLDGQGFGWTPGVGDGQGGLLCCGSWGHKELDTTEQLNWTDLLTASSVPGAVLGNRVTHIYKSPCQTLESSWIRGREGQWVLILSRMGRRWAAVLHRKLRKHRAEAGGWAPSLRRRVWAEHIVTAMTSWLQRSGGSSWGGALWKERQPRYEA